MFCKGGEDRAALNLPARLSQHVPPKINATCKKIAKSMIEWPVRLLFMICAFFAAAKTECSDPCSQ
jgi:hypothetical protein